MVKMLNRTFFKRKGLKQMLECEPGADKQPRKRVLFSEEFKKVEDLPENIQTLLAAYTKDSEIYEVELKYENFDASIPSISLGFLDEVLKELLPATVAVPTGYEIVGEILHFNLGKEYEPYKGIIGQVYLDVMCGRHIL